MSSINNSKNIENKKTIKQSKRNLHISDLKIEIATDEVIKSNRIEKYKYAF